jgi:hypothetical protein
VVATAGLRRMFAGGGQLTWARLDDQAWNNERLLSLTPEARLLWFVGLSFVASEWPKGRGNIGAARAVALARMHGIDECFVKQLREAGRWEPLTGGGFHVHHVEHYMRMDAAEAGRLGGLASAESRLKQTGSAKPASRSASRSEERSSGVSRIPEPGKSPNGDSPQTPKGVHLAPAEVENFTASWNANCGGLPNMRKAPTTATKQRLVVSAVDYFDSDYSLLEAAIRRYAANDFIRAGSYGYETFCRHPERWSKDTPPRENRIDRDIREFAERSRRGRGDAANGGTVIDMPKELDASWIPRSMLAPPR